VIDSPNSGATVQLSDPPVRTRVHLSHAEPGAKVSLRLVTVDPAQRLARFDPA
jgi:hypothetical protein